MGFSVPWVVVSVARMPSRTASLGALDGDTSWLMGLAATFQQGSVSGRDYHFTYGVLAQILAYVGVLLNEAHSVFDAVPLMMLSFSMTSILLLATILLMLSEVDWKDMICIYIAAAALNLFSEPTAFRGLALVLCFVATHRAVTCATMRAEISWATTTGGLMFASQLLTPELGLFSLAGVTLTLGGYALAGLVSGHSSRIASVSFARVLIIVTATFVGLNMLLSAVFAITGAEHVFLDYQVYSLKIARSYPFVMGSGWALGPWPTLGLSAVVIYCCMAVLRAMQDAESRRQSTLLVGLAVCSLISMKTAFVRSDIGHITSGLTPVVFLFLLLGTLRVRKRYSWRRLALWASVAVMLWFSWPWAGAYAFTDFTESIAGRTSPVSKIKAVMAASDGFDSVWQTRLPPDVIEADGSMIGFPADNYIPIGLGRTMVAPVLVSHNAHTVELQQFYREALAEKKADLAVMYAADGPDRTGIDGVQTVSRVPLLFEFFYREFELNPRAASPSGPFLLQPRATPRDFPRVTIEFDKSNARQAIRIAATRPQTCAMLRLEAEIHYTVAALVGRPARLQLSVYRRGVEVLSVGLVPIEIGRRFWTLVDLSSPGRFFEWFTSANPMGQEWDEILLTSSRRDWLDVTPSMLDVHGVECVGE